MTPEPEPLTFLDCLMAVWSTADLMAEYRRLTGTTFGLDTRLPIERLIDDATGHEPPLGTPEEVEHFLGFVWDTVWVPLQGDTP